MITRLSYTNSVQRVRVGIRVFKVISGLTSVIGVALQTYRNNIRLHGFNNIRLFRSYDGRIWFVRTYKRRRVAK